MESMITPRTGNEVRDIEDLRVDLAGHTGSKVRGSQSRPLQPTDLTFWEILSYFTIGTRYIMVKTLISPISNIKVKSGRGEIKPHKNTSMDKKKKRPMLRKGM